MRLPIRTAAIVTMGGSTLGLGASPALAHGGGSDGVRAASYINPDNGMPTENPDVEDDSSCARPDQKDRQQLSDRGAANRNVHNDACFLDGKGQKKNGPASFQSSGVGSISACPDPDGPGPEYAALSDTDRDGRVKDDIRIQWTKKG